MPRESLPFFPMKRSPLAGEGVLIVYRSSASLAIHESAYRPAVSKDPPGSTIAVSALIAHILRASRGEYANLRARHLVAMRPQVSLARSVSSPLIMIAVIGTLAWEFPVTLPTMAVDTFPKGAGTHGLMAAVMAGSAVVGGAVIASRVHPRRRALGPAAIGWGIAILAAALAPTLAVELAALVFVGYGNITFDAMAKTTLQLSSIPVMRGRVMALWALAWGEPR